MARILRGAPVAASIAEALRPRVDALAESGRPPVLALLRVGERPDDLSYERGLAKRAAALGIGLRRVPLPEGCDQGELEAAVRATNEDVSVAGCLMFRPLPEGLDEGVACDLLSPEKDVDGVTPLSLAGVFAGGGRGFSPCTAEAVLRLLDFHGVELAGRRVVVVGRSLVVGRPVALLLQARDATVTLCHSRTADLAARCREAEVLVVATGRPRMVGADFASSGQAVVDVGISWDAEAGRLVGDVDFERVEPLVSAITPVPGGIGSVTTAVLMEHVVEAAERQLEGRA